MSIAFVVVAALALHGTTLYNSLDRTLADDAEHFRSLAASPNGLSSERPAPHFDSSTSAQLYTAEGSVPAPSNEAGEKPPLSPLEVIAQDDGPAYGAPWNWISRNDDFGDGWFATTRDPGTGERIRVYVREFDDPLTNIRYVETWTSLASLDRSVERFRLLILGLGAFGVVVAFLGSVIAARQVLNPISTLMRTARAITVSRGFSRRVPERGVNDELGQLERILNEMLRSLEEAYRAQQQFVADAAHELRTPLTSIRGNIHVLARLEALREGGASANDGTTAAERAEAISYLESEAARMSQLVDELLTLARADSGHSIARKPVELDAVLLSAVAELSVLVGGRSVTVDQLEPIQIVGDELRLKQLVLILLDNALKYTGDTGEVTINLRRVADDAVLEVTDTGIGISTNDITHLFERFYRSEAGRAKYPEGTGLGLSIARWVVDMHDGDITVESTPGKGSRFTVQLPLEREPDPASSSQPDLSHLSG